MNQSHAFSAPAHFFRPSQSRAVVVGGGTMGADVAVVLARAGCQTTVVETSGARHDALRQQVEKGLRQLNAAEQSRHLVIASSLEAVDWTHVDVVIECIPERLDWKQALFAQLAQCARADALLCSNSSSFPISAIAQGLPSQERMVGLHFFMPAHLTPLVEVVSGAGTAQEAADNLYSFMRQCGMVPVRVKKDLPGFLANRLQHALAREAFALIDAGIATPEDVDAAVRFGFGFRFLAAGPVLQRDHAGLEVHCAAGATMYPSLAANKEPAQCLSDLVAQGKFGMKSGEGFFQWTPESMASEKTRYQNMLLAGLTLLASELPPVQDAALS
ncbi:3-hydroxyacyl-CoA dehydrogenase NAD-binding domain-containing protein [Acidovorax sp. Be4]|uniref:3-hydroxyacyl-CoA dehydrogenase NAD-binding domain-containing protein n=1 Tax=Acidovorax bellezanensis TaxID=2976702 RepID=A0ABT2PIE0_9BURK|nr:3-hydroxyacyl-CoA dehydrogenase NAD-binding domain-containing protein [Acidovorax sp. Be4]MCT9810246.1 3-hydroxyacyl-CoA dehydrogenase NAD-binding domain-containing protein [Acidovorax sp. Be4]